MSLPIIKQVAAKAEEYLAYETDEVITWCSNCGNYGIQNALKRALVLEGLTHRDIALCFDVGCSGNGSDKIEATTIHGLHGRVISLAAGVKLGNPKLKVIASAGDGATLSEGINHLIHGVRNNFPMVFIHHNNENYGLTIGQASATTPKGAKMNSSPDGVYVESLNPLDLVLSLKPSFVARSFSSDVDHMTEVLQAALNHDGFAFIEVLQTCPTFNKSTPDHWYTSRIHKVEPTEDIWEARKLVQDLDDKIAIGVLYKNPNRTDFLSAIPFPVDLEVKAVDVSGLMH
jgi:2-oxoglutarate ferredoxin oxidoreductase subunit beta